MLQIPIQKRRFKMVFDIQAIYTLVMAMFPTLVNIVTLLVGFRKLFKSTSDIEAVKAQYSLMAKENARLRKQINELLTKIDHIDRKE